MSSFCHYKALTRIDKPIGIYLLFIPCLWGMAAAGHHSYLNIIFYAFLFLIGSVLMRSSGCIINDYMDRDLDKFVARTQKRPLASGAIPPKNALLLFGFLLLLSAQILWFLPLSAVLISVFSVLLVTLYPLMKRVTYWPQIFLGLTFNTGIIIGYITLRGNFDPSIIWVYLAGIFHTIGYDTIYAFQDIEDDVKIGIKSTAQKAIRVPKLFVGLCYFLCLSSIFIFHVTSQVNNMQYFFMLLSILHAGYSLKKWNVHCKKSSLKYFKNANIQNILLLLSLFHSF